MYTVVEFFILIFLISGFSHFLDFLPEPLSTSILIVCLSRLWLSAHLTKANLISFHSHYSTYILILQLRLIYRSQQPRHSLIPKVKLKQAEACRLVLPLLSIRLVGLFFDLISFSFSTLLTKRRLR